MNKTDITQLNGLLWWAHTVKSLLAMRETWVRSLGWEDPLEEGMTTHFSALTWRIPWTEEPGGLQSTGLQRVGYNSATSLSIPHSTFDMRYVCEPELLA